MNKLTRREFLYSSTALLALSAVPAQAQAAKVATLVGNGMRGTAAEGDSVQTVRINNPYGLIEDKDRSNLYWVDNSTHRVLRLNYKTKTVSIVAGTGTAGYSGDGGPAKSAQ